MRFACRRRRCLRRGEWGHVPGMDTAADTPDDDLWLDPDGELRWETVTRTLAFVVTVAALLAAAGVSLLVSGQLLDELCQTSRANTDKTLLDACQGRLDEGAPQVDALAAAARPAAIALAAGVCTVFLLGMMLLLGYSERTRQIAAMIDAPATWIARGLVVVAALATGWLAIVSIQRLLSFSALS